MTLRKATVRKEGDEWVAEYDTDTVPAIKDKGTKKDPDIKVDIGIKLEPRKVRYPVEKYSIGQVIEGTQSRLDTKDCEMCKREEQVVGVFIGGLYAMKEQRDQLLREKQPVPQLPPAKEENQPLFPILRRPSILVELHEELKGG